MGTAVHLDVREAPGSRRSYLTVHVRGSVVPASVPEFAADLAALGAGRHAVVEFDLSEADALCVAALDAVAELQETLESRGGGLRLVCADGAPAWMMLRALGIAMASRCADPVLTPA